MCDWSRLTECTRPTIQGETLTRAHIGLGHIAMMGEDNRLVCLPIGSELVFAEPIRQAAGNIIKPGYRLVRTFIDETDDAPFRDKMTLEDGVREVCLSGLMVGQIVRVLQLSRAPTIAPSINACLLEAPIDLNNLMAQSLSGGSKFTQRKHHRLVKCSRISGET